MFFFLGHSYRYSWSMLSRKPGMVRFFVDSEAPTTYWSFPPVRDRALSKSVIRARRSREGHFLMTSRRRNSRGQCFGVCGSFLLWGSSGIQEGLMRLIYVFIKCVSQTQKCARRTVLLRLLETSQYFDQENPPYTSAFHPLVESG